MSNFADVQREELLEQLADLRHDLGKHARLPLTLLRQGASPGEVREALASGLLRTRCGPASVRSARQLWEGFCAEARPALAGRSCWAALAAAVERALAWEQALAPGAPAADRGAAEHDLAAVAPAIRALEEELARDA